MAKADHARTTRNAAAPAPLSGIGRRSARRQGRGVFVFFSNRLGCLGSLAISALVTLGLLALLGWI